MKLEHVALWTRRIEDMKDFYVAQFGGRAGARFDNPEYGFSSYFVEFDGGARLEIMQMPSVPDSLNDVRRQFLGWIHIAFSVPTREEVDRVTNAIRAAGHTVLEEPHATADDFYESTVLDPDGNRIEITLLPPNA